MSHKPFTEPSTEAPLGVDQTTEITPAGLRSLRFHIWGRLFQNLKESRDIIWLLALRDITIRYRQSILGVLWVVAVPIAAAAIFASLAQRRVLPIGDTGMPYVLFALWNLSVWQTFSSILIGAVSTLAQAGPLVTRINFPKESLIFSAIGRPLVDFGLRLLVVAAGCLWLGVNPGWGFFPALLLMIPLLLMALGFGFVLSILNLVVRDIDNALNVIMTFAVFLAPILYPPPTMWPFMLVNILNPVSPLLIGMQNLIIHGTLYHPLNVGASSLFSIVVFLIGWRFFVLVIPRIAERA